LKLYFCNASPHHKFQGTGKALIILSLIAATKNQISAPEKSNNDRRPVMTPLSFRHFPSGNFEESRKKFIDGSKIFGISQPEAPSQRNHSSRRFIAMVPSGFSVHRTPPVQGPEPRPNYSPYPYPADSSTSRENFFCGQHENKSHKTSRVPSLVELMLHRHRTAPSYSNISSTKYKDKVYSLPLGEMLRENVPFYYHYDVDPASLKRQYRGGRAIRPEKVPGPKRIYLTSATLIVVHDNVMMQWERQIEKHFSTPLRVLNMRTTVEVPSVKRLATDFDVSQILL
jgi:SNF2-related domain